MEKPKFCKCNTYKHDPDCPMMVQPEPVLDRGEYKIGDGRAYGWTEKTGAFQMGPKDSPELVEFAERLQSASCPHWRTSPGLEGIPYCDFCRRPVLPPLTDSTLQLLVIDLGDSCVVKCEKGYFDLEPFILPGDEIRNLTNQNHPYLLHRPFAELRSAIDDALEGEKPPVPRLQWNSDEDGRFIEIMEQGGCGRFSEYAYKRLCDIAGHPLPVWEPKKGEWVQIFPTGSYNFWVTHFNSENDPPKPEVATIPPTLAIWRYTR